MLFNHFRIALRHLLKNKLFSLINIVGLSVGISAFVLIVQYISFEISFDRFHQNHENIYRVGLKRYENGELVETSANTFTGVRGLLKKNFPEVRDVTGFYKIPANTGFLFRHEGKIYNESGGWFNADSAFFNVFPLLTQGNPNTVLKEPNSVILSERVAKKLFGDKNPVGQTLDRIDDHTAGSNYIITGIFKDLPINSHFQVTIIENIKNSWPEADIDLWSEGRLSTYVSLVADAQPESIEARLNDLLTRVGKDNPLVKDHKVFLQRMTDIHLSSSVKNELEANGNLSLLYLLGAVGLLTLLIAWINYVNLETSRFAMRVKEFGIRRIIGSGKTNLIVQFLSEYLMLTAIAMVVAGLLIFLFSPYYSQVLGVPLNQFEFLNNYIWGSAFLLFVAGSFLVGAYPAFFLAKFNPVLSIKGKTADKRSGTKMRQSLVVVQFTASIILIAFVFAINEQLDFMRVLDKGVELESVIAIRNSTAYSNQELTVKHGEFKTFEDALLQYPTIRSVATSSAIPGTEVGFNYVDLIKRNLSDPYNPTPFKVMFVSDKFIPTYQLELVGGSEFSVPSGYNGNAPWETENWSSVILNESAVRVLGFDTPEQALNQEVYFQPFDDFIKCKVIGVIKDYHHEAAKKNVVPTILFHNYGTYQQVYYSVGFNANSGSRDALGLIEKIWRQRFPDRPFEYFFLNEYYDRQFKSEVQFQKVFGLFAGIAIVIAAMGVLGMTLFQITTRLREISIRKVLGASGAGIVALLSRTNLRLILVSAIIAIPIAYYSINEWLSAYPSKVELSYSIALIPLLIVSTMVLLVSGVQTLRAASSDPIKYLKNE